MRVNQSTSRARQVGGQMMASAGISFIVGRGERLPAIGGEKVARWSPVVTLLKFPRGAYLDQSVIHIMVKYFAPDRKQHASVRRIALFIAQETVLHGIAAAQDHVLLALCAAPEIHAMRQTGIGAELQPFIKRPIQEGIEVVF